MKFSYTHHMPYTDVDEAGQDWPIPNKQFDPEKGVALYREYIDNKVFAEEVGFDWIGCNEHHMSPYGLMPNPNLTAAAVIERTSKAGILQSGKIVPLTNLIPAFRLLIRPGAFRLLVERQSSPSPSTP